LNKRVHFQLKGYKRRQKGNAEKNLKIRRLINSSAGKKRGRWRWSVLR